MMQMAARMRFSGKTVLIVGSTSGIGEAVLQQI
jgi:NAD(P)-dependent dehydrogenase (short-subunit alcohol dehydrogenase family)